VRREATLKTQGYSGAVAILTDRPTGNIRQKMHILFWILNLLYYRFPLFLDLVCPYGLDIIHCPECLLHCRRGNDVESIFRLTEAR